MSRNILNNQGIYVNTISAGDGISLINNNTTLQSVNVDISKQSSKSTVSDTDLFILEESDGGIKKITGAHMKSQLEQSTVTSPLSLTGNNISIKGLSGFTANKFLKVNNGGDGIEYADSTNFWTYSSPTLRPDNTSDNLLLGTTSNTNSRKLIVVGDTELEDMYLKSNKKIISTNNSSDYLQFGNGTFTNNYASNVFTNTVSFGANADLNLATGRAITLGTSSTDRITFNSGNFTFGNTGIFNNSIQVKSTNSSNSGNVSFFEASANGTNNIDLHCPETTTHDYNAYLPKITNTGISSVYILSNKNVLGGTNVTISNPDTDTITINSTDTNTEYTAGTNLSLSGTQFNLDSTLTGAMTFSNTITFSAVPVVNQTLQLNGGNLLPAIIDMYDINGNFALSIRSQPTLTANRDLTLPAVSADDFLLSRTSTDDLTNKSFTDLTTFNLGLAVKNSIATVSGSVQFYNKDNTNYVDLRLQDEDVDSDISVFLPTTLDGDVLVGRQTTDILQNKTFNSNTQFNLAIQLYNIQAAAITSSLAASQTGLVLTGSTVDVDTNMKIRNTADQDEYIQIGDTFNINYDEIKVKENCKIMNAGDAGNNDYIQLAPDIFYSNCLENRFKNSSKLGNDSNMDINLRFNNDHTLFKGNVKTENGAVYLGTDNSTIHLDTAVNHAIGSSNGSSFFTCYYNQVQIGDVRQSSTSSVSYNTTSDYRLKTDVQDFNDNLSLINKLRVKKYKFISDKNANINQDFIGFIAHEVQEVDPIFDTIVNGTKDDKAMFCKKCNSFYCHCGMECDDMIMKDKYQSIDYGKLTPNLVGAVQELYKIIQQQQEVIDKLLSNFKKS